MINTLDDKITNLAMQNLRQKSELSKFSLLNPNCYKMTVKIEKSLFGNYQQTNPRMNEYKIRSKPQNLQSLNKRSIMMQSPQRKINKQNDQATSQQSLVSKYNQSQQDSNSYVDKKKIILPANLIDTFYLEQQNELFREQKTEIQQKIVNLLNDIKKAKNKDPLKNIPVYRKNRKYVSLDFNSQNQTQNPYVLTENTQNEEFKYNQSKVLQNYRTSIQQSVDKSFYANLYTETIENENQSLKQMKNSEQSQNIVKSTVLPKLTDRNFQDLAQSSPTKNSRRVKAVSLAKDDLQSSQNKPKLKKAQSFFSKKKKDDIEYDQSIYENIDTNKHRQSRILKSQQSNLEDYIDIEADDGIKDDNDQESQNSDEDINKNNQNTDRNNKVPPYLILDECILQYNEKIMELLRKDKDLRQFIKYFTKEKQFINFATKIFKYSFLKVVNPANFEIKQDWPQINLSETLKQRLNQLNLEFFKEQKVPKPDQKRILNIIDHEWQKVARNNTLIDEMGGQEKVIQFSERIFKIVQQRYNIDQGPLYQQNFSQFFLLLLEPLEDDNSINIHKLADKLKSSSFKVTNGDFFYLKKLIYDQIELENVLSLETRLKIVTKCEQLRYKECRQIYGMDSFTNKDVIEVLYQFIKQRKQILEYFGRIQKKEIKQLATYIVESVFGYQNYDNCAYFIKKICKCQKFDDSLLNMLQNSLIHAVKRYNGVSQSIGAEIQSKFFWIKVKLGIQHDYYLQSQNVDLFINKLNDWIKNKIEIKQMEKHNPKDLLNTSQLGYFLTTSLTGCLSVQDILPLLQQNHIKPEIFEIWLVGLKNILFTLLLLKPQQVIEIIDFLKMCFNAGLGK